MDYCDDQNFDTVVYRMSFEIPSVEMKDFFSGFIVMIFNGIVTEHVTKGISFSEIMKTEEDPSWVLHQDCVWCDKLYMSEELPK